MQRRVERVAQVQQSVVAEIWVVAAQVHEDRVRRWLPLAVFLCPDHKSRVDIRQIRSANKADIHRSRHVTGMQGRIHLRVHRVCPKILGVPDANKPESSYIVSIQNILQFYRVLHCAPPGFSHPGSSLSGWEFVVLGQVVGNFIPGRF